MIARAAARFCYNGRVQIDVEPNPNCDAPAQFVFRELGEPRLLRAIRVEEAGAEGLCDVTGVEKGGAFTPARAVKVADSGAAYAWLIAGGAWGIRLRRERDAAFPWDLADPRQRGEPFKLYGDEADLVFAGAEGSTA